MIYSFHVQQHGYVCVHIYICTYIYIYVYIYIYIYGCMRRNSDSHASSHARTDLLFPRKHMAQMLFYTSHASVEHAYESSDVVVARNVADVGMGSRVLGIQPPSPNGPNLV